jgi:hypothetical protein
MSYYYKYNFLSPEPVYSTVKEELKSYFDTGAVDDLMFPTYLDKCLRKLGRNNYVIREVILDVWDFEARLPDNFFAVREAWMCAETPLTPYQTANSFYSQAFTQTTIQVSPITTDCAIPSPCCGNVGCDGSCMPEIIETVYKTNQQQTRSITRNYLMQPGNINGAANCNLDYGSGQACISNACDFDNGPSLASRNTPFSSGANSFDIRDNKFVTNVRYAVVHLVFYATEYDTLGNQMIPDNFRIREYIESFLKFKVFETLSNQLTDETFEQIQKKLMYYKQLSEEAFIMADIEIKKQDPWTKQRKIKNDLNRFNMYELPNRSYRYGRRRNN